MNAYCIAYVSHGYMYPVSQSKLYKRHGDAQKACDRINADKPENAIKATVLCANNWHKEKSE